MRLNLTRRLFPLDYWTDRLIASDPGLDRLRSGARAVLTVLLAILATRLLARWSGVNPMLTLVGVVVPMMTTIAVQEPTRGEEMTTMALTPLSAGAAVLLGSSVSHNAWLSSVFFLATIFVAFEARRFGARGRALGMVGYMSYFFSMFLRAPFSQVGWLELFIFAGCATAFGVRFWLVPESPQRSLRSQLRAYRARISVLLHELAQGAADGENKWSRRRIRASLSALNDQSLQIASHLELHAAVGDDEIAPEADDLRYRVLRCEIAAEALTATVRAVVTGGDGVQRARSDAAARLAELLARLRRAVRGDIPFVLKAFEAAAEDARLPVSAALRWRLRRAARTLATEAAWGRQVGEIKHHLPVARVLRQRAPGPAGGAAAGRESLGQRLRRLAGDQSTRQALQATVAALGAMLAGRAISPTRWYWAVIAAFVVFARAMTLGQALSRAWQRVLGTLAGVGAGLLIAELVRGHELLEMVLLFLFIGAGFYLFRASYSLFVLLLTTMLAMLYELLGRYSAGVLYLRLEETLAGAAAAVLSAALVMPVRTSRLAEQKSAALLREAGSLLRSAFAGGERSPPHEAVRELDRHLQGLRQSLGPVTGASYPGPKAERRLLLHRLSVLVYCIRHLYSLSTSHPPQDERRRLLQQSAQRLAGNMDLLARRFDSDAAGAEGLADAQQPLGKLRERGQQDGDDDPGHILVDWMWQASEVVRAMYADATA